MTRTIPLTGFVLACQIGSYYLYFMPISKEDLVTPAFSFNEPLSFDGTQVSDLLIELEKYIFKVEDAVSVERRVQFLYYDLQHHFQDGQLGARELLNYLVEIRGLTCLSDQVAQTSCFRISNLCHRRQTSLTLLALFVGCLFAKFGIPCVHFTLDQQILLRTRQGDDSIFFDLLTPNQGLNSDHLLHLMTHSPKHTANLESLSIRELLTRYLRSLKFNFLNEGLIRHYLRTLNVLIEMRADKWSSTELVERGLFFEKIQYKREALMDLKRYFHFCKDPDQDSTVLKTYQRLLSGQWRETEL